MENIGRKYSNFHKCCYNATVVLTSIQGIGKSMAYLLNSDSILMCPHGGTVVWVSSTYTSYKVGNRPPMLKGDVYTVVGCNFIMGAMPNPCSSVEWVTGSPMLTVKGRPVLTHTSVGLCVSRNGLRIGPVMVASYQRMEMEPTSLTSIST